MISLQLKPEQQQIVESAEAFLTKASPMNLVRATANTSVGMDTHLWSEIANLGWCGVHLPEEVGGLNLDWVSLCLLQEQMGRRLACVPFFDSAVLSATAFKALLPNPNAIHWLGQIVQEQAIAAMSLSGEQAVATPAEKGWQISGTWPVVGSAQLAHVVLLPARTLSGETLLFALPAQSAGLKITSLNTLDKTRSVANIQALGVNLQTEQCLALGPEADAILERITYLGAIGLAAEQVGVAQQCLDMALAYVLQRQQFGKAIASFQAIKHRCALMLVEVESARSAVYGAACLADTQPDLSVLMVSASQARVTATEASQFCARENLQLHGGVGFTWEYDPHLYLRRSQASSQRLGPVHEWLERVAALIEISDLSHP